MTDSIIFFQEDGKPVYSYTSSSRAKGYVSRPLTASRVPAIGELYRILTTDIGLQGVQSLIRSSLETEEDLLRSFLAAWIAFERFVNNVFDDYKDVSGSAPEAEKLHQTAAKGNSPLMDRFKRISIQLSPETSDSDYEVARKVNRSRNELAHRGLIDETSLQVKAIRDLVRKYLRLHIKYKRRTDQQLP